MSELRKPEATARTLLLLPNLLLTQYLFTTGDPYDRAANAGSNSDGPPG